METTINPPQTVWIDISLIDVPPDARPHSPEKLDSLAEDMKANGQLQEIVTAPLGPRYEVVAGVGRVLAARKLGWDKIRCLIKEGLSEFDKARITYAENEEREDADPFYQAAQLQKMMKAKGWSQNQLADNLGQARRNIQIYLGLLTLDPQVAEVARRLATPIGQLTELMRLSDHQEQVKLAQECHDKDLSVRQLKALVDRKLSKPEKAGDEAGKAAEPAMGFHFAWKERDLVVHGRWSPAGKGYATQSQEFQSALAEFLDAHPKPKKKPEPKAAASVA